MLGPLRRKNSDEKATAALRRKALKELRQFTLARRLESPDDRLRFDVVGARLLRPGDGVVLDGIARVDESALDGPGEPVLRSATRDAAQVAGGTRVVSGWLVVGISAGPEHCLLRRQAEEQGG